MATFLSPGVFPREIDISLVPQVVGPLRPAFIGTAKKGPLNTATFVSSSQMAIDTFGEPFSDSYLMYAVLSYMEEGNSCYIVRVGVVCEEGQDAGLDAICIDDSGNKEDGWGRIPVFTGIDFGKIDLREVTVTAPAVFHDAAIANIDYNDVNLSSTDGPTTATLSFAGAETVLSTAYTGCIDDSFVVLITGDADASEAITGATFEVIRNSDGTTVATGTLQDDGDGTSQGIDIGDGLGVEVVVTSGALEENDTFTFTVQPLNRDFTVSVEGGVATTYTMPAASYTSATTLAAAINLLLSGEGYEAVAADNPDGTEIPQLRTSTEGERIQLTDGCGWAKELGIEQYAWDIPRSYVIGADEGPYNITTSNNRVKVDVIAEDGTSEEIEFTVANGLGLGADDVASLIDLAGTVAGENFWESFALTVPGESEHIIIVSHVDHQLDQLRLLATFSNVKTLRFVEELGIAFPYTRSYRGFTSNSLVLPEPGAVTPSSPLSCEDDPLSAVCSVESAYFAHIVGYLIATTSGTWIDGYTASIAAYTEGVGDVSGRFKVTIKNSQNVVEDIVQDVSFDPAATRFIANVVNTGSSLGGTNGNPWFNWEHKPDYISEDVRQPAQINNKVFKGMADGIPTDPELSNALDAAVIGRQSDNSGIFSLANVETLDINLVAIPGFSSGSVIAQGLQLCESRGDCLFLVDPPFGLRPQQVVDWHNGMLLSDLTSAINSSYGALYYSWQQVFDQFSRERIWVPPSGHVSAVFSRTARIAEQWSAPAGLRRGRLLTVLDIEYDVSNGDRDLLYGSGNAINPITKFAQDGIVVWGQRTLQRTASALDRVNVRMLLSFVKKNLTRLLRNFIFEPNDRITWAQARAAVESFLADIQGRRGLEGFKVVIDETNNTPERRDRHELWVSVFLKPTQVIEFVVLNLVILQSSASFSADEVLAAGGIVQPSGVSPLQVGG